MGIPKRFVVLVAFRAGYMDAVHAEGLQPKRGDFAVPGPGVHAGVDYEDRDALHPVRRAGLVPAAELRRIAEHAQPSEQVPEAITRRSPNSSDMR